MLVREHPHAIISSKRCLLNHCRCKCGLSRIPHLNIYIQCRYSLGCVGVQSVSGNGPSGLIAASPYRDDSVTPALKWLPGAKCLSRAAFAQQSAALSGQARRRQSNTQAERYAQATDARTLVDDSGSRRVPGCLHRRVLRPEIVQVMADKRMILANFEPEVRLEPARPCVWTASSRQM